jgi:hypothetical protein
MIYHYKLCNKARIYHFIEGFFEFSRTLHQIHTTVQIDGTHFLLSIFLLKLNEGKSSNFVLLLFHPFSSNSSFILCVSVKSKLFSTLFVVLFSMFFAKLGILKYLSKTFILLRWMNCSFWHYFSPRYKEWHSYKQLILNTHLVDSRDLMSCHVHFAKNKLKLLRQWENVLKISPSCEIKYNFDTLIHRFHWIIQLWDFIFCIVHEVRQNSVFSLFFNYKLKDNLHIPCASFPFTKSV